MAREMWQVRPFTQMHFWGKGKEAGAVHQSGVVLSCLVSETWNPLGSTATQMTAKCHTQPTKNQLS